LRLGVLGLMAAGLMAGGAGATPADAQQGPAAGGTSMASTPDAANPGAKLSGGRPVFGPPPGMMLFTEKCGTCHTQKPMKMGAWEVPTIASLNAMPPEQIYTAMTTGKMAAMAASFTTEQKRQVAEFLAGRKLIDKAAISASAMTNRCRSNPPLGNPAASDWNGWSPTNNNARFQANGGLAAADLPKLTLKWAFGLPGGASSFSQPTVAAGRVFVGSDNTAIYSLDEHTGCVYWSFIADSAGRYAPVVAPIKGHPHVNHAVFFATASNTVYAVNARNGRLLWKAPVPGLHAVSASLAYYDGRLYVPFTGTETVSGSDPHYQCCRSRGAVAALDANTGRILWQVTSIPEPLQKIGKNQIGTQLWGPSGASVWNTPTIDPKRHLVYVGTGNSFGPVAAATSDSVLALSMKDGRMAWHYQLFKDDSFMLGCADTSPAGGNCPQKIGEDWDFGGSSVILQTLADGRDVLVAAGKGGVAIGLDPDNGKLLWRTPLYDKTPPTADGLVVFGGAADGQRVYYSLQRAGGGLTALQLDNGRIDWTAALDTDARGGIGAVSALPGAVLVGGWDGVLRAVNQSGQVVWHYDTRRKYATVNGVEAHGGSLGSPGPTIADGMVFVSSGYIGMQNGYSGNVILAFAP